MYRFSWRTYICNCILQQSWPIILLLLAFSIPVTAFANGQATTIYLPIGANDGLYQGQHAAYTVGIQFVNLAATAATVELTAYAANGDIAGTGAYQAEANQTLTFFPIRAVATGFSGALRLTSSQNGMAIANLMSSDFSAGASYISRSQGATTVYLPLLVASGCNKNETWFSLQNTGTAEAEAQVTYSDGITATATIKAGAAHTFYQAKEGHQCRVFAGTVTSTQPMVATVIQEAQGIIFAYNGFTTSGATNILFPLINVGSGNGYLTGIQLQNTGNEATEVTLSYLPSLTGTSCTETQTIPAGNSKTFTLLAFNANQSGTTTTCTGGARFVGSAQVTGNSTNQPLVGIANQLVPGHNGEAYTAFAPAEATAKVVLPLIMDRNNGFFTGFSVMNVGTVTTTVDCIFTNTSYTVTKTLALGEAVADIQFGKIAERYVGAATCTASGENAKIVGIVNELGAATNADQLLVYEGINQ